MLQQWIYFSFQHNKITYHRHHTAQTSSTTTTQHKHPPPPPPPAVHSREKKKKTQIKAQANDANSSLRRSVSPAVSLSTATSRIGWDIETIPISGSGFSSPVWRRLAGSCSCGALRCRLPEARTWTKEEWWWGATATAWAGTAETESLKRWELGDESLREMGEVHGERDESWVFIILIGSRIKKLLFFLDECYSAHL